MKRFFILLFLIAVLPLNISADPVSVQTAAQVGRSFLTKPVSSTGRLKIKVQPINLELVYMADSIQISSGNQQAQKPALFIVPFYVFNADNQGYVIVAGDDRIIPILGYADTGTFDPNNLPPNMQKWLEGYKAEIRYAIENNRAASAEIQAEWQALESGTRIKPQTWAASVAPLISTRWDQSPYYNDLCPYDNLEGEKAVTGCVATAMAQVIKFWNYPVTGTGFHSYNHSTYGTLSANFGSTTYNWASMPNQLTASSSTAQINAVATLMYHCGVGVEMNYNVASQGGSAAMTICSGYSDCTVSAEDALKTYFGYKKTLQGLHKSNYTHTDWTALLKTELDAGRPMVYAGRGDEGGHAFVCDGYDYNDYFHFNWGWGGTADGYFSLTALNPGSGGAGGGSYVFTDAQRAIIGIEPENGGTTTKDYDLRLYSDLNLSEARIWFTNPFTLTVDIGNFGTGTFSGNIGAAIFDSEYNFVDFLAIYSASIQNGYYHTITYEYEGSASLVPGTYYVAIFYKTTIQDWTIVADGDYTNIEEFEIYYSADIETYSAFNITTNGGKLIQGSLATVNVDVLNSGSSTFYGRFRVNLSTLDGSWAQNIQILNENNGLPSNYHYTSGNDFTGTITVEPGTYLLEIAYQAQSSSSWYYAGSSNYSNPVYVIVEAPSIQTDIFENNNTQSQATILSVSFTGNNATRNTNGSNFHVGTDIDFYKIVLPSGYNYTIVPRLHDEYNSGNGQTYSVDALFSYSTDGIYYSETYDDVMTDNFTVKNGGTVFFKVAPYFSGNTGTYLLDLNLSRIPSTGIEQIETNNGIYVYPNPARDFVVLDLQNSTEHLSRINLFDVQGRTISSQEIINRAGTITLPLTNVPDGVYFMQIHSDKGVFTQKIIVKK